LVWTGSTSIARAVRVGSDVFQRVLNRSDTSNVKGADVIRVPIARVFVVSVSFHGEPNGNNAAGVGSRFMQQCAPVDAGQVMRFDTGFLCTGREAKDPVVRRCNTPL